MNKTAKGLVSWAKEKIGCPYWYGTFGQKAGAALLDSKIKQYPSYYNQSRINRCKNQYGRQVFDCVGLIKGYIWSDEKGKITYNPKQDVSANGMLEKCKVQGKISTLPEKIGLLLFMEGHVGIYVGNGYAIEATVGKSEYRVKKSKVEGRGWKNWGQCPYISYEKERVSESDKSATEAKYISCKGIYNGTSVVDALKSVGLNSSFAYRKKIAEKNKIKFYIGSGRQNVKILDLMKRGVCIKP